MGAKLILIWAMTMTSYGDGGPATTSGTFKFDTAQDCSQAAANLSDYAARVAKDTNIYSVTHIEECI